MKNEKTSTKVASIASKLLRMDKPIVITPKLWKEIKSVAGTTLTQAPDKKTTIDYRGGTSGLKKVGRIKVK